MAEDPEQQVPNRRQRRRMLRSGHNYGPPPPELHPSVAHLRGIHRAAHPDMDTVLEASSHLRMSVEWSFNCPRFINGLRMLGLHCVTQLQYIRIDQHLITALVERWSPQTNSFHLPVGEMSITLQDVAMILGVQVDGPALIGGNVIGEGKRWRSWPDCCTDLLGRHPEDDVVYHDPADHNIQSTFQMGQAKTKTCVPLRWLRWAFQRDSYEELTEVEFKMHLRAYVLYIFGCFLLPDTSGSEVHLQFLPLLENLELFATYSLGGAVLAHLYRELCEATRPIRVRITGCLHLLQVWSWEHLHVGRPTLHRPIPSTLDGLSVGVRWNEQYVREMPPVNLKMYRDELDGLVDSQVIWEPYDNAIANRVAEVCLVGREIWRVRVPLLFWKRVEWHLPDRVIRQFGFPPNSEVLPMDPAFQRKDGRGKADIDWAEFHQKFIAHWDDRRSFVCSGPDVTIDFEVAKKRYMRWYRSWAALYLLSLPEEPPRTYYPRAPVEREYRDFFFEAENILKPFFGLRVDNPYQAAINKIDDIATRLRRRLHITEDRYEEPGDLSFTAHGSPMTTTQQLPTEAGPSSFHEHADISSPHDTVAPNSASASILGWIQDEHWDLSIEVNEEQIHEEQEDEAEAATRHELRRRPLRAPATYTPGSDAIPRRERPRRR